MGDNGADAREMTGSYKIPHARNLPLPVISLRPSSETIRRAACGVTPRVFATIPADTSGFAITSSTSSGSFEDVWRPSSFRSYILRANASRSCSFRPSSAAAKKPLSDCKQPSFPVAMSAPIDGNGFQAEIDGGEMGT